MRKEAGKDSKNFQTECFKVVNEAKVAECSGLNGVMLEHVCCETNDLCLLWSLILREIFRDL